MSLENGLGKVIEYKSRTRAEINETVAKIVERTVIGFGNLMAPIAEPIARAMDRVYGWVYK